MEKLNPATVINPNGDSDWLLICEHASNRIPQSLGKLGLADEHFNEHIAYDIGAYEMTLTLSEQLNATAIFCNYSRLVIDCNRTLTAPDCIPATSDGVIIPDNQHLSQADKRYRIEQIYQPFHHVVSQTMIDKLIDNPQLKIANIHSFTPMLAEEHFQRPWEIGFIYRNPEPTRQIIEYLKTHTPYHVGDNEPYNGFTHKGYTLPVHADAQDIPGILVEFRQDLIADAKGRSTWAEYFIAALKAYENYDDDAQLLRC